MKKSYLLILCFGFTLTLLTAQEKVNDKINSIIKDQGLEKSKVMDYAFYLTDVYGPRLTGSDMTDQAVAWAVTELKKWACRMYIPSPGARLAGDGN